MANTKYSAKITESSRAFTAEERIKYKDIGDAVKLDDICEEEPIVITIADYAVISIHNEKADTPDYDKYLLITPDGDKYVTGSPSFWSNFNDFREELAEEGITTFSLKIYKRDSTLA